MVKSAAAITMRGCVFIARLQSNYAANAPSMFVWIFRDRIV
jgi:hypothetical protein